MPKSGYSSVTIPQLTYSQLGEIAKARHETISSILVQLVNGTVPSTVLTARFEPERRERAGWYSAISLGESTFNKMIGIGKQLKTREEQSRALIVQAFGAVLDSVFLVLQSSKDST
jgi:hypothetical protein